MHTRAFCIYQGNYQDRNPKQRKSLHVHSVLRLTLIDVIYDISDICLTYSGHALGIWICECSLFYKRELWASKSAGAHSNKSLKIIGCKR